MMKYCGQCGQEWSDSFQFCPHDGTPLAAAPPDPLVGQLLANKYKILSRLGQGPHGTVYRAHHRIAEQPCAIKFLNAELTREQSSLERVRTAVRKRLELRSGHSVRLYDFDFAEGMGYFLVEELVEGESLETLLKERRPLPAPLCASLAHQICDSLGEAHAYGLWHGSLNPANVLLTGKFPDFRVKISDYGLVPLTQPEPTIPTADPGTDLISLGGLLFQMLTGTEAFAVAGDPSKGGRDSAEVQAMLQGSAAPAALGEIALSLLARDPRQRFTAATEIASALREALPAAAVQPEPSPTTPPLPEPRWPTSGAAVRGWRSAAATPTSEPEPLPLLEGPRLSVVRLGIVVGLVALLGFLIFWLWREKPAPTSAPVATTTSKELATAALPPFDYEIVRRPNEGDPIEHPHVLVRVSGLPLYIIRDQGPYLTPTDRARAVVEALGQAAEHLQATAGVQFILERRAGTPTIVLAGLAATEHLPIVAISRADVYAYNIRSSQKTTEEELAQWWLARTRDYLYLLVLGQAPRLTTRTDDGAALLRLYEVARSRSRGTQQPVAQALRQALEELDPKLKEQLQTGIFQFPGSHDE